MLLEKLVERWNNTGFMKHLEMVKTIVCESRNSTDFEETLKSYYQAIRDSQEYVIAAFTQVLLFAYLTCFCIFTGCYNAQPTALVKWPTCPTTQTADSNNQRVRAPLCWPFAGVK